MSNRNWIQRLGLWAHSLKSFAGILWRLEGRVRGVEFEGGCRMVGRPVFSRFPGSRISLGDGVELNSSVRSNPMGCFQPCVLRTQAPGAEIRLGRNVGLSGAVFCAGKSIRVGEGTIFGSGAVVIDNDFHAPDGEWGWVPESERGARPVIIGRGVFVAARAIILKGVTVGDRAVVGAGAVVTCAVPPHHLAVGNPARVLALRENSATAVARAARAEG